MSFKQVLGKRLGCASSRAVRDSRLSWPEVRRRFFQGAVRVLLVLQDEAGSSGTGGKRFSAGTAERPCGEVLGRSPGDRSQRSRYFGTLAWQSRQVDGCQNVRSDSELFNTLPATSCRIWSRVARFQEQTVVPPVLFPEKGLLCDNL